MKFKNDVERENFQDKLIAAMNKDPQIANYLKRGWINGCGVGSASEGPPQEAKDYCVNIYTKSKKITGYMQDALRKGVTLDIEGYGTLSFPCKVETVGQFAGASR